MVRAALVGLAAAACAVPGLVSAAPQIEILGSLVVPLSAPAGAFTTDYVPTLVFGTATGGEATHTLNLDGGTASGFDVGLNWLPNGRAGLQVLVERISHALAGPNDNYELTLDYLSRPPPDLVERPSSVRQSIPWPDTTGRLTTWRVSANGIARLGGRSLDLSLSGGFLWSRLSGVFERAGYYEYHLGGHSTLFYQEVLLDMAFDTAWRLGYNVGADLGVRLGRGVAVTAGIRFFGPVPEPEALVGHILNEDEIYFSVSRADIEAALGGTHVTFDDWTSPVLRLGMRVGF